MSTTLSEIDIKAGYDRFDDFLKEPAKYKPKFKFNHWIVFRVRKEKKEWCGYQIPLHIESFWDEYDIINFNTGELKKVDESFINDIVNATTHE